jgi:hypothetical protein
LLTVPSESYLSMSADATRHRRVVGPKAPPPLHPPAAQRADVAAACLATTGDGPHYFPDELETSQPVWSGKRLTFPAWRGPDRGAGSGGVAEAGLVVWFVRGLPV